LDGTPSRREATGDLREPGCCWVVWTAGYWKEFSNRALTA
jgi:hypothetical protein